MPLRTVLLGRWRPGHQRFVISGGGAECRGVQQAPGGGRLPETAGAGALGPQGWRALLLHPQRLIPCRLRGGRRLQGWQWLPPHWSPHRQARPMYTITLVAQSCFAAARRWHGAPGCALLWWRPTCLRAWRPGIFSDCALRRFVDESAHSSP